MRAAVVHALGEPPVPGELPDPAPRPGGGEALIRVRCAALNPLDLLIASGLFYGGTPAVPYAPGVEGVGVVVSGERFPPGTRVRFEGLSGALAELAVVPEHDLMPVPGEVPDALAAGLGVSGLAAWLALEWRAKVAAGEKVLVLGATGVVGQLAVQAAKLLGAGRVVAAGRDREVLRRTLGLGADAAVPLDGRDPQELSAAFIEAAGGQVDVIVDTVWGEPAVAAAHAAAARARLVNLGQSAGPVAGLPSAVVRGKLLTVLGHTNRLAPEDVRTATFERLAEHAVAGRLHLPHETVALAEVGDAWRRQSGSPNRKLVVRVDAG